LARHAQGYPVSRRLIALSPKVCGGGGGSDDDNDDDATDLIGWRWRLHLGREIVRSETTAPAQRRPAGRIITGLDVATLEGSKLASTQQTTQPRTRKFSPTQVSPISGPNLGNTKLAKQAQA